jgi:two-component system LytT family response regulator
MKVIIVEDEISAANNMIALLQEIDSAISVQAIIQSVEKAVEWIKNNPSPELAFFDIQLTDSLSFDIFENIAVNFPVVFTTAFDSYTLKAFKVNSIDYLLKPINKDELISAINKHKNLVVKVTIQNINSDFRQAYKKTLLVKKYDGLIPVAVNDFAYFVIENGVVKGFGFKKERYAFDETLDKLEKQLSPSDFFRANRQFIVSRKAIEEAQNYHNRRFILKINPSPSELVVISKTKVSILKDWLRQ